MVDCGFKSLPKFTQKFWSSTELINFKEGIVGHMVMVDSYISLRCRMGHGVSILNASSGPHWRMCRLPTLLPLVGPTIVGHIPVFVHDITSIASSQLQGLTKSHKASLAPYMIAHHIPYD